MTNIVCDLVSGTEPFDQLGRTAATQAGERQLLVADISDRDRIVSCMKAKVSNLSPGCKAVFVGGPKERGDQRTARLP